MSVISSLLILVLVVLPFAIPLPEIRDEVPENFEGTEIFDRWVSGFHGASVFAAAPA
jgi:hypothetical protein